MPTVRHPPRAICQKLRQSYRSVSTKLSAGGAGPTGFRTICPGRIIQH